MDVSIFVDVISDLGFALDKTEAIKSNIDLNEEESQKVFMASTNINEAMNILRELFPSIESLDSETREKLKNELF